MRLLKETIEHFANKNVNVRWYPQSTYEEFYRAKWEETYAHYFNWYKDNVAGCNAVLAGRTNIVFGSTEELQQAAKRHANMCTGMACRTYDYTTLYIEYGDKLIVKSIPTKSKEVTVEFIQKLIDKNEKLYKGYYGNFALKMQKALNDLGLKDRGYRVYPTTYGIGVWVLFNSKCEADIADITKLLDSKGIKYQNEYSDAHWVYRFKISK